MRSRWLPLSLGVIFLSLVIGLMLFFLRKPETPSLPSDRLTIAPTLMTYPELAQRLSTSTHQIQVDESLKQRGVLIALKNRSYEETRRLLEDALEIQFEYLGERKGVHQWRIVRNPEAVKRDKRLFDAYVRVITQQVRQELDQYAPLLSQPRQTLKRQWEQSRGVSGVWLRSSAFSNPSREQPLSPTEKERLRNGLRLYWAQSLDGYVMLRWLSTHWNESMARQLIQKRMIKFERPLAMGLPGITPNDVDEFLKGQPGAKTWLELVKSLGKDHDWVVGVVGWDASTRTLIPYCDFVSVSGGGTGWLFVPVTLLVEPQPLEKLFEQMGEEARTYYQQTLQVQGEFPSDSVFIEGFPVEGAPHLSQVLERWAQTFDREVVMELAPDRESLGIVLGGRHTLRALLTDLSVVVEPQKELFTLLNYLETCVWRPETDMSHDQLRLRHLTALSAPWYYEYKDGVLMARNRLAFLDRQYDYPLEVVITLERSLQREGKRVEIPLSALVQFGKAVLENAENPSTPALSEYRLLFSLRGFKMAPFFAMIDSLPNKQPYYDTLKAGGQVSILLQQFNKRSLSALAELWKHTSFYGYGIGGISYPFGEVETYHPQYLRHLVNAEVVIRPDSTRRRFSVEGEVMIIPQSTIRYFFGGPSNLLLEGQAYEPLQEFCIEVKEGGRTIGSDSVFYRWKRVR